MAGDACKVCDRCKANLERIKQMTGLVSPEDVNKNFAASFVTIRALEVKIETLEAENKELNRLVRAYTT
jgi:hypothetical protein